MILFAGKRASGAKRKKANVQKMIYVGNHMNGIIKNILEKGTINISNIKHEEQVKNSMITKRDATSITETTMVVQVHHHDPAMLK